ncbi:MAG: sulfatase-like hydrolase/transferase, partial [Planctomycetes bacterium]|nr:sulfatase-like hydrolase/transferase [Planctomycetota bacterium]
MNPFFRSQQFARLFAWIVCTACLATSGFSNQRPPNVLFILTDDQRWDALGLAGNKHLKTPNIDRLGKEGV